jgi:transcriptional repressor NrdR
MKCPVCHHDDTKVVDSRVINEGFSIRRRRECLKCTFRFSTYEELEILDLMVVKRNGNRESYQREKLVHGLRRALEKRPITDEAFKKLVTSIERDLQKIRKNEVTTSQVGALVMKHLKKIDKVAYIRFASVYQSFKDLQEFSKELNKLIGDKKKKEN